LVADEYGDLPSKHTTNHNTRQWKHL